MLKTKRFCFVLNPVCICCVKSSPFWNSTKICFQFSTKLTDVPLFFFLVLFRSVNSAFTTLRTLIPTEPKNRKLSKIETLRLASSYIAHLGTQLSAGKCVVVVLIPLRSTCCFFLPGPIEQPCLRVSKQTYEIDNETSSSSNRHQVCTFCIAHKKGPAVSETKKKLIC